MAGFGNSSVVCSSGAEEENKKAITSFRRLNQHAPSAKFKWKKSLLRVVKLQVLRSKYAC
jgi:hypothetical protein